jgi:hypothetical protein
MKVCYFIQSHKNPQQIYRLVRAIKKSSPFAQIIIGHDFTNSYLDMTVLQNLPDVHFIRINQPAIRGDFSLLQPYLQAINWLITNNSNFDWLVYISGQDYPTQPISNIEDFLAKTVYDGFMLYFDASQCPWQKKEVFYRYLCQYYRLPDWAGKILSKALIITKITPIVFSIYYGSLIGLPAKKTPFSEQFTWYGGSQWHTLSRKCVYYIRNFIRENPQLVKYYKKTLVPDESFIQTILINNRNFNICCDNKRYIDFTGTTGGHARILTSQDYETITTGGFHFARKIEQNADILDMLDTYMFSQEKLQ